MRDLADFSDIVERPEVLKNVQLWDRRVVWEISPMYRRCEHIPRGAILPARGEDRRL